MTAAHDLVPAETWLEKVRLAAATVAVCGGDLEWQAQPGTEHYALLNIGEARAQLDRAEVALHEAMRAAGHGRCQTARPGVPEATVRAWCEQCQRAEDHAVAVSSESFTDADVTVELGVTGVHLSCIACHTVVTYKQWP